ncbi:hypothetical protein JVW21_20590, partial [Vibrio cholerae O1]|uniref:hypothetical protein n=1 Tax=Vibrio cholerae TaxID=666 RepID=UPI001C117636
FKPKNQIFKKRKIKHNCIKLIINKIKNQKQHNPQKQKKEIKKNSQYGQKQQDICHQIKKDSQINTDILDLTNITRNLIH